MGKKKKKEKGEMTGKKDVDVKRMEREGRE